MYRTTLRILMLSLAGTLLCGIAFAQQSSAPASSQAPASTTTAPKAQKPATSTGNATAKKPAPTAPFTLKTQKDKASYAIGVNIGRSMKKDSVDVDPDVIARGIKDAFTDKKLLLTDEESQAALTTLKNDMQKHQQEEFQAAVEKNKREGDAFLAANKAKPGVVTTATGLQYKVLQEGTGPKPAATDTVVCNYKGTLVDGTEFDSSYKRGQPATFPVSQVIKGWTEALQLMPVGSKWELYIPPSLGYGERGTPNGGPIGPNATLIFEVELVSVQPKPQTPAAVQPQPQTQQPQAQPQAQQQQPPQAAPQAAPQAKPQ